MTISDEEHIRRIERLKEYQYIKCDIEYYTLELQKTIEYKTTISHVLDGLPSGNIRKKPEDKWIDLMEYTDEIIEYLTKQIKNLKEELIELETIVDKLPARERSVIKGRYIAGMSFREIAKKLPLSDSSIYRAHNRGILLLELD